MSTVKILTSSQVRIINKASVKAGRNRTLVDDVPLDPDGVHMIAWTMIHNDCEIRARVLLKLIDQELPAQVFLDMSFDHYNMLEEVEVTV